MQLTLSDILELPSIRGGEPEVVCTGPMDQPVRWVHVSDLADLSGLLTGGELVLTTGQALADPARRDAYLPGLADAGATGVVVELGLHIDALPESVRAIGDGAVAAGDRPAPAGSLHRHHRRGTPQDRRGPVRRSGVRAAGARGVHRAEHAPRLGRPDRQRHGRDAGHPGRAGGPQPTGAGVRRLGHAGRGVVGGLGASLAADRQPIRGRPARSARIARSGAG